MKSAVRMTSIRLDTKLADDALKVLGRNRDRSCAYGSEGGCGAREV